MGQEYRESLLRIHLAAVVPLAIPQWADPKDRSARLDEALKLIAEHGDDILFGGPHCRDGLSALVDAVAILAYQPGGVTMADMHFEAQPSGIGTCRGAKGSGRCCPMLTKGYWVGDDGGVLVSAPDAHTAQSIAAPEVGVESTDDYRDLSVLRVPALDGQPQGIVDWDRAVRLGGAIRCPCCGVYWAATRNGRKATICPECGTTKSQVADDGR